MTTMWLEELGRWFDAYVNEFLDGDERSVSMLELKRKHSVLVAGHCRDIAAGLGWPPEDVIVSEAMGILHDIARFSQFAEYGTFQDAVSINHGERGCEIAAGLELVSGLPPDRRKQLLDGIRHHNARSIPASIDASSLPYLKLIRDADKLDIYRIMSETLASSGLARHLTSALQVEGTDTITAAALADIRARTSVDNSHITSAGDFLLMQLSWVYDINYPQALRLLRESGIIDRIGRALPGTSEVRDVVKTVLADLDAMSKPA